MLYIRYNLLLVHMRKTGGTSLEKALGESDNPLFADEQSFHSNFALLKGRVRHPSLTDKHSSLRTYRKILEPDYFKQLNIVCTTRNPWQRMISMYFWSIQKQSGYNGEAKFDKPLFLDLIKQMIPLEGYVCPHRWHFNPLLGRLINPLSLSPVSLYLRQEHLQEDYEALCQKLGISAATLPSLNLSKYADWRSYYDEECRDRVAWLFRHEIKRMSYVFS